jgi:hypothetical protein
MRISKILLLLVLLIALCSNAFATKYAGAFMDDGGGARALGMGGAFTAVASDPSATYWNPAGLSGIDSRQFMIMHSERFGDLVDRDFASFVQPVSWSLFGGTNAGIGITLIRLGIDDIPFTSHLHDQLDLNGDNVISDEELMGLFNLQDEFRFESDSELALFLSYAEQIGLWQFGSSMKLIRQEVGSYSSVGIGFDIAALRPNIWRSLSFGIKLQDITTTYLSWSTGENEIITPAIVPGLSWNQNLPSFDANLIIASALETRFDNRGDVDQFSAGAVSSNLHLGAELGLRDKIFLRAGFDSGFKAVNRTAGIGFQLPWFQVDYAYGDDVLGIDELTHRISVTANPSKFSR